MLAHSHADTEGESAMKVIIAGGRDFDNMEAVRDAVKASGWREQITEIVSGACLVKSSEWSKKASGADGLGELWAHHNGIAVRRFYADLYGEWPSCGPKRNAAMAAYADALILMPGNRGTASMRSEARKRGLPIYIAAPSKIAPPPEPAPTKGPQ